MLYTDIWLMRMNLNWKSFATLQPNDLSAELYSPDVLLIEVEIKYDPTPPMSLSLYALKI